MDWYNMWSYRTELENWIELFFFFFFKVGHCDLVLWKMNKRELV